MPRSPALHSINAQIGQRLRQRRLLLGLSQSALGGRLGISFQQVQKYEKGTNGLSPDRLISAAEVLGVPIMHFFEGLAEAKGDEDSAISARNLRLIRHVGKLAEPVRIAIERLASSVLQEADRSQIEVADRAKAGAEPEPKRRRRKRGAAWDPADIKWK